jgi:plasmid maintenance system killer protein
MLDMELLIEALSENVPDAITNKFPNDHPITRGREQVNTNISPQNIPRYRNQDIEPNRSGLIGPYVITEEFIERLPELDDIFSDKIPVDGIDALAFYVSYHFTKDWGIKIFDGGIYYLAGKLQAHAAPDSRLDALDYIQIATNVLQLHEYFHFIADIACTLIELSKQKPFYVNYSNNRYPKDKTEEALANAYTYRKMIRSGITSELKQFMLDQPPGYRDFNDFIKKSDFQSGRQRLLRLMCELWNWFGSATGSALLFRIDKQDLDYNDVPTGIYNHLGARKVHTTPLLFVQAIPMPVPSSKYKKELSALNLHTREEATKAITLLAHNTQHPSLHFEKLRGLKNIFTIRVNNNYRISLTYRNHANWELRRIGTHQNIYLSP